MISSPGLTANLRTLNTVGTKSTGSGAHQAISRVQGMADVRYGIMVLCIYRNHLTKCAPCLVLAFYLHPHPSSTCVFHLLSLSLLHLITCFFTSLSFLHLTTCSFTSLSFLHLTTRSFTSLSFLHLTTCSFTSLSFLHLTTCSFTSLSFLHLTTCSFTSFFHTLVPIQSSWFGSQPTPLQYQRHSQKRSI